ncbi:MULTISPECIES: flagellar basal body L-ring protein FlgH [unclassified Pseudodesulfovibrio]|uniref:flagellar basal body L-ring protein FlgH n=1 Tax=unclassified Pseudodesulfovibrio TaxID=2661612 RepID=UPI000FEC13FE|nr:MULTISPECIES: flagellar basal body L-ring protein FlgH [unclassified Pseudodesulfovibrio]MCJ2163181.1 flagellar basal body L-ring protein FlgH [Pseudodesulfovibrio sp. S3-i]RWU07169.1 flagellar basal body L-ring protein [Pseudodesulfovibrio sp. S3]
MRRYFIIAMASILLAAGCAPKYEEQPMPELTQPVFEEQDPALNPGSLFDSGRSEFLYDDNRASRVGDIVMVQVAESATTKIKSETTADKSNDINTSVTAMPTTGLIGAIPLAETLGAKAGMGIRANQSSEFSGNGETKQESEFDATVATRIVRRLPGNILQVEGARRIRVNHETQFLVVRGLIRQRDISSNNTIPSTSLAEAQIEIYGQGVLADKQRPGWLSRILDNIYPF